jgi:hypothetical protein
VTLSFRTPSVTCDGVEKRKLKTRNRKKGNKCLNIPKTEKKIAAFRDRPSDSFASKWISVILTRLSLFS